MPQGVADTREEFACPEGLRQIIVGTGVKTRHNIGFRVADRKDEHGNFRPIANFPEDLDAVDVRQTEIEDYQLGPL